MSIVTGIFSNLLVRSQNVGIQIHDTSVSPPMLVFQVDASNRIITINGTITVETLSLVPPGVITPPGVNFHLYDNNNDTAPQLLIEQNGVGDSSLEFLLTGGISYIIGIDNSSNNDPFKISAGSLLGVNDMMLIDNTDCNIAIGLAALDSLIPGGINNIAFGNNALTAITFENNNVAVGCDALILSTANGNIALGHQAGNLLTTGNNNICIGNSGIAGDTTKIKIGTFGVHTNTFIAGISGVTPAGSTEMVIIDIATGELGSTSSGGGIGDVVGPGVSVNNRLALFNGITGKLLKQSTAIIDTSGALSGLTQLTVGNIDINLNTITTTSGNLDLDSVTNLVRITADALITGDLNVQGTIITANSENVSIAANYLHNNTEYTADAAQTGGLTVRYDPTTTTDTVNGNFIAGVVSSFNPTVITTGTATFLTGDIIAIDVANDANNNGIYEVSTHSANILTIRGIGTVGTIEDFTNNQFIADTVIAGTITKINIAVLQANTLGNWGSGKGSVTGITFSQFGDVVGPGTSTDNRLALFSGGTGKLIKQSTAILDTSGALSGLIQLDVDNLRLDGNSLTSTNVNGDINITPNGTGDVVIPGSTLKIGNTQIKSNLIESTDVNGNIVLTPNGTGIVSVSSQLTIAGTTNMTGGLLHASTGNRVGPGVIDLTDIVVEITTTGTGDVLTLANGTDGQVLKLIYIAEGAVGDTATLTPTTYASSGSITFTDIGDTVHLMYKTTGGWYLVGSSSPIVGGGGSGSGDVVGPGTSTDNRLALFSGGTGKLIKQSTAILDTSGIFSGVSSVTIGSSTNNNTWYGFQAGDAFTASALRNSAFGENALTTSTSGDDCTAIGYNALMVNTLNDNTAIGSGALAANIANQITAVGSGALAVNTTGSNNVAVGYKALNANTDSSFQTAVGENSMLITTGGDNTAIGSNTLLANTTGDRNVALGSITLLNNTIGGNNVGIGHGGGRFLTTGSNNICISNDGIAAESGVIRIGTLTEQINTFIQGIHGVTPTGATQTVIIDSTGELGSVTSSGGGDVVGPASATDNALARFDTTTGKLIQNSIVTIDDLGDFDKSGVSFLHARGSGGNLGIGALALNVVSSGINNIALGQNASVVLTTGFDNIAIGNNALVASIARNRNIAIGTDTLSSMTGGDDNVAIGYRAMLNSTTGSNCVALGSAALLENTGDDNIGLGFSALNSNTTGINNIALGKSSLASNLISNNNIAIGNNALASTEAKDNIGLGLDSLSSNVTGAGNVAIGNKALEFNTGSNNIALGRNAGISLTTGSSNICIENVGVALESTKIRIGTTGIHNNTFIAGIANVTPAGSTETVIIDTSTGELGSVTSSGGGDVVGPASATDNALIRFDTTTGKLIQNSIITIDDLGSIYNSGVSFLHARGSGGNLGIGALALNVVSSGINNIAIGNNASVILTTGFDNIAIGNNALVASIARNRNTAIGTNTLSSMTGGDDNIAIGFNAMANSTIGSNCVALGSVALLNNIGDDNIGLGFGALNSNTTGINNTALGRSALASNSIGNNNIAIGNNALASTEVKDNIGLGLDSLSSNVTGAGNVAIGNKALEFNKGSNNIALGRNAGISLTTGSSNICIENIGVASESAKIRIGTTGIHNNTFIAGIANVTPAGSTETVIIDTSTGELGSVSSTSIGYDGYTYISISSTPYAVLNTDNIIGIDTTTLAITINLPDISSSGKKQYTVSDIAGNASTNNITINRGGSDLINGATSYTLVGDYNSVTIVNDTATNWIII